MTYYVVQWRKNKADEKDSPIRARVKNLLGLYPAQIEQKDVEEKDEIVVDAEMKAVLISERDLSHDEIKKITHPRQKNRRNYLLGQFGYRSVKKAARKNIFKSMRVVIEGIKQSDVDALHVLTRIFDGEALVECLDKKREDKESKESDKDVTRFKLTVLYYLLRAHLVKASRCIDLSKVDDQKFIPRKRRSFQKYLSYIQDQLGNIEENIKVLAGNIFQSDLTAYDFSDKDKSLIRRIINEVLAFTWGNEIILDQNIKVFSCVDEFPIPRLQPPEPTDLLVSDSSPPLKKFLKKFLGSFLLLFGGGLLLHIPLPAWALALTSIGVSFSGTLLWDSNIKEKGATERSMMPGSNLYKDERFQPLPSSPSALSDEKFRPSSSTSLAPPSPELTGIDPGAVVRGCTTSPSSVVNGPPRLPSPSISNEQVGEKIGVAEGSHSPLRESLQPVKLG